MAGMIFLVQWNEPSAQIRAEMLKEHGYEVSIESGDGDRAYRLIKENPPDIIVIDLSRRLSHGKELAMSLAETKTTRRIPMVLVDADEEDEENMRPKLPDAIFTTSIELVGVLRSLLKRINMTQANNVGGYHA